MYHPGPKQQCMPVPSMNVKKLAHLTSVFGHG